MKKRITPLDPLRRIANIIEAVDYRCAAVDGPVSPTLSEMTSRELREIYRLAKDGTELRSGEGGIMKGCGCRDFTESGITVNDEDCQFEEAVALIRAFNSPEWADKIGLKAKAEAFLAKVDSGGKVGEKS